MGPHALVWAPSRAACSVAPAAVAQLVRPRNSTHTRHRVLARAVVITKNSAATANTAAIPYRVERLMDDPVGTPAKVGPGGGGSTPPAQHGVCNARPPPQLGDAGFSV